MRYHISISRVRRHRTSKPNLTKEPSQGAISAHLAPVSDPALAYRSTDLERPGRPDGDMSRRQRTRPAGAYGGSHVSTAPAAVQRDIDHLRRHGSIVCAVGGTASGITGVHEWLFNETPTGTHVTTNESFAGDPATLTPPACERGSTLRWQPGWITSRRPPSQRPDTSPTALPPHRRHHPHPRPDRHPSAFHRRTYSPVLRSADISRHGRPPGGAAAPSTSTTPDQSRSISLRENRR